MNQINEITECCICTEVFTDPRMLPCIHTFCLKCLDSTRSKSDNNSGDTMLCPICRQLFAIPPQGLSGLPKNFFMERLMEIAKIAKPLITTVPCDVCLINKDEADIEVPDASKYCVNCGDNMCEVCSVQHKRQKFSKDHQIVAFGSELKDELTKKSTAIYCNQHNWKELKMYCADCKKVICMMCFADNHQMHKCSDVHKVADGFRDEIDVFTAKIVEGLHDGMERKRILDKGKRMFLKELRLSEDAIKQRAAVLKQLIDKQAQALLDELIKIKATQVKEAEIEFEDIERQLTILNSFNAYCSEIRSKGTSVDICRSVDELRSRAKELHVANASKKRKDMTTVHVSFKSSSVEDMLKTENIVGSLEAQHESPAKLKTTRAPPVYIDFNTILHCSSNVQAVTKLEEKIYVMCREGLQSGTMLYIFEDQDPFKNYKNVWIAEMRSTSWYMVVASSSKNCLYVFDSWNRCIWRIMTDDLKVTKWMSALDKPIILSKSNDGLLVLLRDCRGLKKLETYGPDAKIFRSISLSRDIAKPIHFVQAANGKFIIIHKSEDSVNGFWLISELRNDGQIHRQFMSRERSQIDPIHLSLDAENDRLFVAQKDNSKLNLVILDRVSFEWKQTLLVSEDRDTLDYVPLSLHYDGRKKQLLVGRSDKVAVYQIH